MKKREKNKQHRQKGNFISSVLRGVGKMEKVRNVAKKALIIVSILLGLVLIYNLLQLAFLSNQMIRVTTQNSYYSGLDGICEIIVRDQKTRVPLEAGIKLRLLDSRNKPVSDIYDTKTDSSGCAVVNFETPKVEDGEYYLEIDARSQKGRDKIKQKINIYSEQSSGNVTITLDKSLYKPGDTIQYRVLVTDFISDKPVTDDVEVRIFDGRENQVYKKTLTTSDFGIASGSFALADRVNSGIYTLKVRSGSRMYLKEFEVKPYKLPKFEISIITDKEEYSVGDELQGTVRAEYFFGQPVKGGAVVIHCGESDVIRQTLNDQGECTFTYTITEEGPQELKATVTDTSNNRETVEKNVIASNLPLKITVKTESSLVFPGVPNEIFVFVSKPDGTPLKTYLKILGDVKLEIATDENGMASFFAKPVLNDALRLTVEAMEYDLTYQFNLEVSNNWTDVLIRPDKPVYNENEVIPLSIMKQRDGKVWIYAVKKGQIITSVSTENDKTELMLPKGTYGLIDLVYGFQEQGKDTVQSMTASRAVFVRPEKSLNLTISKEDRIYAPGEDIILSFEAKDQKGNPLNSAILLTISDEALLSLADNDVTLDNIKLALSQIADERGIDAEELYEAILNNSSDAVLTSLMLNESGYRPDLKGQTWRNNDKRDEVIGSSILWFVCGVLVIVLLLCIIYRKFCTIVLYVLGYLPVFIFSAYIASRIFWHVPYRLERLLVIVTMVFFLLLYIVLAYVFHRIIKTRRSSADNDKKHADVLHYVTIFIVALIMVFLLLFIVLTLFNGTLSSTKDDIRIPANVQSAPSLSREISNVMNDIFTGSAGNSQNTSGGAAPAVAEKPDTAGGGDYAAVEKIRRRFMEVMFFHPQIEAQEGKASITIPLADNITTWNIQAVANSQEGNIGSDTGRIQVFQEFFVDFDTPWNLSVGDEAGIPVTVSNYLKQPQKVRLQVHQEDWFDIIDGQYTLEMELSSEERKLVYIPIKVKKAGTQKLRVDAAGQQMADAVEKEIRVYPAGLMRQEIAASGLVEKEVTNQVFFLTPDIEEARNIRIKLYPSSMAQVVEGLEGMLRFPDGCFEQISSSLYPNILVLTYLKDNNLSNPEIEKTAYEYIEKGFQKILTYEVGNRSGSFSLYGHEPAELVLTAYGLMEFTDLSKVYPVDENLLERMRDYIFSQQRADGSFDTDDHHYGGPKTTDSLALNAYIGWALSEADPQDSRLDRTVTYLKGKMNSTNDGYTLALIANILVNTKDKEAKTLLDRLVAMTVSDLDKAYLSSSSTDYYGAYGRMQDLQATALLSVALTREQVQQNVNTRLMNHIIASRDSYGTFGSTQATILSLKALVAATEAATMKEGIITLKVNDREEKIEIGADTLSFYLSDFTGAGKENTVRITTEGRFNYEIIKEYYVPYDTLKTKNDFEIIRKMDNRFLVNDEVLEEIRIVNRQDSLVQNMMVLLQIPQGFTVNDSYLEEMKLEGIISEYSIGYDQIEVYIRQVQPQEGKTLKLGYWAGYPVKVMTNGITVYDYYNPEVEAILPPTEIIVTAQ